MNLFDCLDRAAASGDISPKYTKKLKELWEEEVQRLKGEGHTAYNAAAIAGDEAVRKMKYEAAIERHVALAVMENNRKLALEVKTSKEPRKEMTRSVERLEMEKRSLIRAFNANIKALLKEHHPTWHGGERDVDGMFNVMMEVMGGSSGHEASRAIAKAVTEHFEAMRLLFNEHGGVIGKMDGWFPQSHNVSAIRKAKFDTWGKDTDALMDWKKIINHATGKPFQVGSTLPPIEVRSRFLKEVFDNMVFGRDSKKPIYGQTDATPLYKKGSDERVLHFKDAKAWVEYNKKYGRGTPLSAIVDHTNQMASDIAAMRTFGPNPDMGLKYKADLMAHELRGKDEAGTMSWLVGDTEVATRMFNLYKGAKSPKGPLGEFSAKFFSTTRKLLTSALVDRAMLTTPSDFNTMRLAAKAVGANPNNIISTYTKTIGQMIKEKTLTPDDLLRQSWVMDTMADPGTTLGRYQTEVPAMEIADRISATSMKVQGISQHTDALRFSAQAELWGDFAAFKDGPLSDVRPEMQESLRQHGITDSDWDAFTKSGGVYKAENGATFINPIYWRESTNLAPEKVDDIFLKFQSWLEDLTEKAVPTNSLFSRSFFDPVAYGARAGSIPYEVGKSGAMFKSFPAAFVRGQYLMFESQKGWQNKLMYGVDMVAGATVMGALSLQMIELSKGKDPLDMTTADFWMRAAGKGGGFGPLADIMAIGQSSWGGGYPSYVAGPVFSLADDLAGLTVGNISQLVTGKDTNFAKEFSQFGSRYLPMGQTPVVGPAIDRLVWDKLQMFLDPEADAAIARKAQASENRDGNGFFWVPGQAAPSRAPDFSGIFGG